MSLWHRGEDKLTTQGGKVSLRNRGEGEFTIQGGR